jgi:hypothetical protein
VAALALVVALQAWRTRPHPRVRTPSPPLEAQPMG